MCKKFNGYFWEVLCYNYVYNNGWVLVGYLVNFNGLFWNDLFNVVWKRSDEWLIYCRFWVWFFVYGERLIL